jgi:uncharacterized damage-inducible protein DinB
MSNALATRPATTEYDPYYERYISLVPDDDIVQTLSAQLEETLKVLGSISESQAGYRYAPDKWSIKEVIGHVVDSERIFAYRALRFARNDHTPIEGYDQDEFARYGGFDQRTLADLAAELEYVRRANIVLFSSFNEAVLERHGMANQVEVSVRALLYILAGHERHHMSVLKTRYLSAL